MTVATMPLPVSRSVFAQDRGDEGEDLVAVDDLAMLVGHDQAVGIAIQCDADIGAMLHDRGAELIRARSSRSHG